MHGPERESRVAPPHGSSRPHQPAFTHDRPRGSGVALLHMCVHQSYTRATPGGVALHKSSRLHQPAVSHNLRRGSRARATPLHQSPHLHQPAPGTDCQKRLTATPLRKLSRQHQPALSHCPHGQVQCLGNSYPACRSTLVRPAFHPQASSTLQWRLQRRRYRGLHCEDERVPSCLCSG